MTLFIAFALASIVVCLVLVRTRWTNLALFNLVLATAFFSISLQCLSVFHAIYFPTVRGAVVFAILGSGAISFALFLYVKEASMLGETEPLSPPRVELLDRGIIGGLFTALVAGVLLIILAATAYTALLSVPNNWDSMTYHLPRIEHWLQNRSLEFYPTYNARQNEAGLLAEELILALRSFNHAYPVANLVQWLCFGGCIAMAGRISNQIGASRSAQYVAAVLVATIPMAILQSSSTQTDLVAAFFSAVSVYFLLQVEVDGSHSLIYGCVIAASLAYLAKGTAVIFLAGFVIVYGIRLALQRPDWRFFLHFSLSGIIGAMVLAGHELRLLHANGSLVGPTFYGTSAVHPTWRSTVLNMMRNFGSDLNVMDGGRRQKIESLVVSAGQRMGISDTDSHYSFFGLPFHLCDPIVFWHEDIAPNMVHTVLVLITITAIVIMICVSPVWRSRNRPVVRYVAASLISMVAFCVLIKWQPWITRLQLGEVVLAIPAIVGPLSASLGTAMPVLVVLMGWQAQGPTFYNLSRSLLNPSLGDRSILDHDSLQVLFIARPELEGDYVRAADIIATRRPKQIGLFIGGDGWEFPLWYLLRQRLSPPEMPIIVSEMDQKIIDSKTDMIVGLDFGRHPHPKGMREMPGFGQLFLFER